MTVTALRPAPRAPRVYLAGKIAKNLPWRSAALGDLLFLDPSREWSDYGRGVYETEKALDSDFFMTAHDKSRRFPSVGPPLFTLVGPFFVGCDHGCSHGLGMHAVASCNDGMELDVQETRARVLKANFARIKGADFVFVHIDETDCFGTLVEIGYARGVGVPVHLHFGDKISAEERDQMWFAATTADYRHEGVDVHTAFKNAVAGRSSGQPSPSQTIWARANPNEGTAENEAGWPFPDNRQPPDMVPLLSAHPHSRGLGKVHLVNGETTLCGRTLEQCPGDPSFGRIEEITCGSCLKMIADRERRENENW